MSKQAANSIWALAALLLLPLLICSTFLEADAAEDSGNGIVEFSSGLLSVNAKEIRPEDLMREIGDRCGIKIVVFGEVFSEVPVSLKLQNMPVRKGIERALRVVNITNYLMHFENSDNGSRIVEIDLIGKKGGEKHLTAGSSSKPRASKPKPSRKPPKKRAKKKALKTKISKDNNREIQENFLKIMDEILNAQLGEGEEPDPAEILKLFKEIVPPEMMDQIPPEVLEELEKLE